LRDVVLYRYLKAEPLLEQLVLDVIYPARTRGSLPRSAIGAYLAGRFPEAKPNSVNSCAKATVQMLAAAGVIRADRRTISVQTRPANIDSFAFVAHSEFPEPGMHDLGKLERNSSIRALGWTSDSFVPTLYELRNRGVIAKVSEIDNVRHFTTRYTLDVVVDALTGMLDQR
jgi:DNA repair protein RadC